MNYTEIKFLVRKLETLEYHFSRCDYILCGLCKKYLKEIFIQLQKVREDLQNNGKYYKKEDKVEEESQYIEDAIFCYNQCTCEHNKEDHGYGHCNIENCQCQGGWKE